MDSIVINLKNPLSVRECGLKFSIHIEHNRELLVIIGGSIILINECFFLNLHQYVMRKTHCNIFRFQFSCHCKESTHDERTKQFSVFTLPLTWILQQRHLYDTASKVQLVSLQIRLWLNIFI